MTKADLEKKVNELENELKNYVHMASAVEAKDKEINLLVEKHQKNVNDIENKYQKEIEKIYSNQDANINKVEDKYKKELEYLRHTLSRRENELNKIIVLYGNLLKGLQGQLDNAIEINDYFLSEVKS